MIKEELTKQKSERKIKKSCANEIERINKTPEKELKFKDYMWLKSGYDGWSKVSLEKLKNLVDETVMEAFAKEFDDDELLKKALRWYCRGLLTEKAIRKVKTDAGVTENVIGVKRFNDNEDEYVEAEFYRIKNVGK